MSQAEAAWLAGFMDGEGNINLYIRKNGKKSWTLAAFNNFKPALDKCKLITGAGSVIPKGHRKNRQQQWQWHVTSQRDIASICRQIAPYSTAKLMKINWYLDQWIDLAA
jgi:hypothetical protein